MTAGEDIKKGDNIQVREGKVWKIKEDIIKDFTGFKHVNFGICILYYKGQEIVYQEPFYLDKKRSAQDGPVLILCMLYKIKVNNAKDAIKLINNVINSDFSVEYINEELRKRDKLRVNF